MRTRTVFGNAQYFDFMLRNISLLKDTGDTAAQLSVAQTYVERVDILTPYLKRVAPAADELTDLIRSGRRSRSSERTLKQQALDVLASERLSPAIPRDHEWLNQGLSFFKQYVLPLLLAKLQAGLK